MSDDIEVRVEYKPQRGLSLATVRKWDIATKSAGDQDIAIGFCFPNGAVKQRFFTEDKRKRFSWKKTEDGRAGDELYGWWLRKGPEINNTLVITEGLIDAPSVDQALQGRADVVAIDSVSSAYKELKGKVEELNRYRKIVIAFDDDEPGNKAVSTVLPLFQDPGKLYRMTFQGAKDANELLEKDSHAVLACYNAAAKVSSTDFIHTFTEVAESLVQSGHDVVATYPHPDLQNALRGLVRGRGTVWKGMEGIGKTEVFRWVEHHILKENPDIKVAVVHMEEDEATTIKGLATYEAERPMYFEEDGVQESEILDAYKSAVGTEDRFFIYKVQSSDNPDDILTSVRTLVITTGVDVVFLDNLQKMVDGMEEDNVRQKLVYLAAKLKDMARDLNFALEVISHVNDEGKVLNSRYITKVLDRVVDMSRDLVSLDDIEKGTMHFKIEKNRGGKGTGPAGKAWFNPGTWKYEVAA